MNAAYYKKFECIFTNGYIQNWLVREVRIVPKLKMLGQELFKDRMYEAIN
ncbi:MAG: hypothetical protein ACI85H_001128 [Paracoccaceae bacterium]|jgi:hypothetical protein